MRVKMPFDPHFIELCIVKEENYEWAEKAVYSSVNYVLRNRDLSDYDNSYCDEDDTSKG